MCHPEITHYSAPMPDPSDHQLDDTAMIEAAARHWCAMAALAWVSSRTTGPGAVVIHRADLTLDSPSMQWFAAEDIPKGDDFRTLMVQCDPQRQVVLIVVDEHGDQAVVLEADEEHPAPEQCARSMDKNA